VDLQNKITEHFDGKVVRKDLTKGIKGNAVVPTYVLEYLLGQHCATYDPDIIDQGLGKVKNIIKEHFVHRDEAEIIKSTIKEKGQHKVIDKVQVHLNESKDVYEATFSNLGIKKIPVSSSVIKTHKKLLSSGVWCIVEIGYLYEEGETVPWLIQQLKPIQISNVDLEDFLDLREQFTKEEWVDLLIQSIGLEPSQFSFRNKLIQLSRLIPHCENNYNFIELGPKGTGKSHIFSELSPHGILISGGDVSKAKLFVNNTNNQIGLVGYWDVVAFDEFAGSKKKTDQQLVDIMKNYMANKSFSRGRDVFGATASLAFIGNTEHSVPYMLKNSNLFDALPKGYYDSAFLDRIHMYLPGWEVQKLRNEMFTNKYGFIVDYLAEILKVLRKEDFGQKINEHAELSTTLTTRDKDGITKTFSGLMKIIYPHGKCTHQDIVELIEYAMEGRKRVKDQLIKIDETFEEVEFSYTDMQTGQTIFVETLENKDSDTATKIDRSQLATPPADEAKPVVPPKQLTISENQTGITYTELFKEYLTGASSIYLEDSDLRSSYQMGLLMEFCSTLIDLKAKDEEVELHVVTWNETDDLIGESTNNLIAIAETVFDMGIKMTFEFDANIQQKVIKSSNGWNIEMSQGLDIYQQPEGQFNIAGLRQDSRQCKTCKIVFSR
jgi:ATP-dependent Lon protease